MAVRGAQPDAHNVASELVERLEALGRDDESFWDFRNDDGRDHGHGIFPYPAMMVPALQGTLLDVACEVDPSIGHVYDPYMGAGTVLIESLVRGLRFTGSDINPLAVLLCRVKAAPLAPRTMTAALERVRKRRSQDTSGCDLTFPGRDKWFTRTVARDLARLSRAIRAERHAPTRAFLWICLSGTVRLVSKSRTSTYKLHIYAESPRRPKVFDIFDEITIDNIAELNEERIAIAERSQAGGQGHHRVACLLADARDQNAWVPGVTADLLMTSPPYGDNKTTIPYGQYSYLPLNWIDPKDHRAGELIANTARIDSVSLGGRLHSTLDRQKALLDEVDSLRATYRRLAKDDVDARRRLAGFFVDLDESIDVVLERIRPEALMFWTLGERRIRGVRVPTTRIVSELLAKRGARVLTTLHRSIPENRKRMALRNDTVATMRGEDILVLQGPPAASGETRPGSAPTIRASA